MVHGFTAGIFFQTGFGRIGDGTRGVHENVVPRLVAIRLGLVGRIPVVIRFTLKVQFHDHAAVPIAFVANELARLEPRFPFRLLLQWIIAIKHYHNVQSSPRKLKNPLPNARNPHFRVEGIFHQR